MTTDHQRIEKLFGSYRAEHFHESYGALFIAPPYFSELEAARPSFLVGGRGTGKTTALRSLRFDAPELRGTSADAYLGVYLRINKNRVYAFEASEISKESHARLFAHYFNLLAALEFCELSIWMQERRELSPVPGTELKALCQQLCVAESEDFAPLREAVRSAITEIELYVNNLGSSRATEPMLSIAEAPVKSFTDLISALDTKKRAIFCCIDEYENLLPLQQAVINTYIKHAELPLSYKIGMKTNGLKTRDTKEGTDPLNAPADYSNIDIARETTNEFLCDIVQRRIDSARKQGVDLAPSLDELLPGLSIQEEAEKLGAARICDTLRERLKSYEALSQWSASQPDGRLFFLGFWEESLKANAKDKALDELAADWAARPAAWDQRLGNYGYASLFWLSRGRKGARIRKYYSGNSTFLALANGNIRFYLQLVHEALRSAESSKNGLLHISPKKQTLAAKHVAGLHLDQLDGLCARCGEIKRLVLEHIS